MFKKFLKNSSKFLAVLLTAVLAFSPLSYAADPAEVSTFTELKDAIADQNCDTINVNDSFLGYAGDEMGEQKADSLTINGNENTINGNSVASGMKTGTNFVLDGNGNKIQIGTDDDGDPIYEQVSKETVINDAIFTNFKKDGGAGTVIFNEGGNVTIEKSSFTKNVVVPGTTSGSGGAPSGVGGVISHDSVEQIDDNQESIEIGTLTVKNSYFGQNQAFGAGAILSQGHLLVEDTEFNGNTADHFGAIAVMGNKKDSTVLTRVNFINNQGLVSGGLPNAGAIFFGEDANAKISDSKFEGNTSVEDGGAINTYPMDSHPDLKHAKLQVVGSTFTGNKAGFDSSANDTTDGASKGGAINNAFYGSETMPSTLEGKTVTDAGYVYVANSKFNENKAGQGGAIYNNKNLDGQSEARMWIENTEFADNAALDSGGAIYNNEGTITFGPNVTFTGNNASANITSMVGKGAAIYNAANGVVNFNNGATFEGNYVTTEDNLNDVYNDGELNFIAGSVTMTGGVKGDGSTTIGNGTESATVALGDEATFEQANLTINENSELSVNIEKLKIYDTNNNAYGTIYNGGNLVFSTGTGTLQNSILPTGTATTSEGFHYGTLTVKENADVTIQGREGNNITINQKDIIIEEDANLTITNGTIAPSISLQDNIKNDGVLTFNGNETMNLDFGIVKNEGDTGNVVIDGSVKVNAGDQEITQSTVTINSNAGLTVNANKIITDNAIANAGKLTFKRADGDNDTSDMINGNEITGVQGDNGMEYGELYIEDNLTNAENVKQAKIFIDRDVKVTNSGEIVTTGEGIVINGDAVLVTSNKIDTYTENPDGQVVNNGIFEVALGEGHSAYSGNKITGSGGTFVVSSGEFINDDEDAGVEGYIEQSSVQIAEGAALTTKVEKINVTDNTKGIQNAGVLTLTGNSVTNNNVVTGLEEIDPSAPSGVTKYGETILEGSDFTNSAAITQSTITVNGKVTNSATGQLNAVDPNQTGTEGVIAITETGSLTTNADNVSAANGITVANGTVDGGGTLTLTGGTVNNTITGEGTLIINNNVINESNISLSTVTVANDAFFTNDANGTIETNYISGASLSNNGIFVLNAKDDNSYDLSSLSGVGVSSITAMADNVTVNLKGIQQGTVNFYGEEKTLVINGGDNGATITADTINNYATGDSLHVINTRFNGNFVNNQDGHAVFEDGSSVSGLITNNGGQIDILKTDASFEIETGITGDSSSVEGNLLNIGNSEKAIQLTTLKTIENQNITVSQGSSLDVVSNGTDNGTINNSSITVVQGGSVSSNASWFNNVQTANDGFVSFDGGTISEGNTIIGSGVLNIAGNTVTNYTGIEQSSVTVQNGATFKTNASSVTATAGVFNAGELIFDQLGSNDDMVNNNVIDGLTTENATSADPVTTYGNLTVQSNLINNANITQNNVNIKGGTTTNIAGATIKVNNSFNVSEDGNATGGTVSNSGVIDAEGASIANGSIGFIENADGGIITAGTVTNYSEGTINNLEGGSISAALIENKSWATITNFDGGTISATDGIANKGTVTSSADGIDADFYNGGTYNITGGTVNRIIDGFTNGTSIQNGTINMADSEVTISTTISNNVVYISTSAVFKKGSDLTDGSRLYIKDGAIINIDNTDDEGNPAIGELTAAGISVLGSWIYTGIDVDLQQGVSDKISSDDFYVSGGTATIGDINLLTKKASKTKVQISTVNIYAVTSNGSTSTVISTGDGFDYSLDITNDATGSWLEIGASGYGDLPNAVYDKLSSYTVEEDVTGEGKDYVTRWIEDDNSLKTSLNIEGNDLVLISTTEAQGLQTSTYTLTVSNVEISSFTNAITVNKEDENSGTANFTNVKFTDNRGAAVIASSGTVVLSSVTFENNTADKDILNDGTLEFAGGPINLQNGVDGNGQLIVSGNGIESTSAISQSTVTINPDVEFKNSGTFQTKNIAGGTLNNEGIFALDLETDSGYGLNTLYGNGVSSITVTTDSVTVNLDGIQQGTVNFYGEQGTELTLNGEGGATITANEINNYVKGNSLHVIDTRIDGNFVNNQDGHAVFENGSSVAGLISNNIGRIDIVKTDTPFVIENGVTSTKTDDVTGNLFYIGDAENDKAGIAESSTTIAYQNLIVSSGSLTMIKDGAYGAIDHSRIEVKDNGELTAHVSSLTNVLSSEGKTVYNDGKVTLIGHSYATDNENAFVNTSSGKGNLVIDGNINNKEGVSITQSSVTVLATSTLTANASNITGGTTFNDGQLIFTGTTDMVNNNVITGIEYPYGNLTVESTLQNNANIEQAAVTITGGTTTNNADVTITTRYNTEVESGATLINGGTVNAKGYFFNFGTTSNSGTIISTSVVGGVINDFEDNLTNSGNIVSAYFQNGGYTESSGTITASYMLNNLMELKNLSGGSINAKEIINKKSSATITNFDGGTITAGTIDNYVGATVYNDQNAVIESTKIINSGVFETTGTITANEIINESSATITNFDGGTIKGENDGIAQITNKGTLTSNADGIIATVFNTGTYNVTGGTVSYNVTGATGGTVNIENDDVTVAADTYISQNEIYVSTGLKLLDETALKTSTLIIKDGAVISTQNDKIGTLNPDEIIIDAATSGWTFSGFDVDLKQEQSDNMTNISSVSGVATINDIHLLSDKASRTFVQIATTNINAQVLDSTNTVNIYTSSLTYSVTAVNDETIGGKDYAGSWLQIEAYGYGGLPAAVYDGANFYDVTVDTDVVTKWVEDGDGIHDTLKTGLAIDGHGKIITTANLIAGDPEADYLSGLKTSSYTLTINNVAEWSGFTDAISVNDVDGNLVVKDVTFSSNTGNAVITNQGNTTLSGVTFDETNTATVDVANDGEMLLTGAATTFNNGISGAGTTTIRGVAVDMSSPTALLQQKRVEISDIGDSSLTANIENTDVDLFMNHGQLVLLSSTTTDLNSEINGIGDTTISGGTVTTTKGIAQTNIYLSSTSVIVSSSMKATTIDVDGDSSLTADADNIDTFAAGGKVANAGTVEFTGGTNKNIIDGNGQLIISGAVINSTGAAISQSSITVASGSFETSANDITTTDGVLNKAELILTGGTLAASNTITGDGNLTVTGDMVNEADIEQSVVTVSSGTTENNGSIVTTGTGIVIEEGARLVAHGEINTYKNAVDPANAFIDNSGILEIDIAGTVSPDQIKSGDKLKGSGTLMLTRGGFNTYDNTNGVQGSIEQTSIIISSNAILTSSLTAVTTTEGIVSGGTINFAVNEEDSATNDNAISGDGILNFAGGTITNNKNIQQNEINVNSGLFANNDGIAVKASTITVATDSALTANADDIKTIEKIAAEGTVEFTGGTNKNIIDGNGQLLISGDVINSTGTAISLSSITVASGSFETSANDITTTDGVVNDAELTLTGGTLAASNAITGSGNLTVTDNLTSLATIQQDGEVSITKGLFDNQNETDGSITAGSITVASGAGLKTKANSLATDNGIANEGDVTLTGGVLTASNTITGTGNLFIAEAVTSSAAITQSSIVVTGSHFSQYVGKLEATDVVVAEGSDVTIGSEFEAVNVLNDGVVSITNGLTNDSSAEYKGIGTLNIAASTTFNNNNSIKQSTVTVEEGSTLKSSADDITTSDGVLNAGTFMLTGGTNKNVIAGKDGTLGELIIADGSVVNSTGTAINQKKIIISSGKEFTTSANDVTTEEEITNYGTMNFTGGTNENIISGNGGVLNIKDSVVNNQKNISQETINVEKGTFENVRGGIIHATTVDAADETTVITDATDFNVTDMTLGSDSLLKLVDISSATLKTNVTGDGALVKEGEGIVTLSGTNDYAGTTTISEGALQISSATNIGTNTIYADGGKLIVDATDAEVELGNKIVGTYGDSINDVKLEVVAGTATLNDSSIIYGNGNLEKTGEGILNLLMDENKYIGDTVISSGTVIGTTKNIKGKVIGSGDETSAVEFYDADGEVILNEIDTTKYIGTFAKTGASTMTVTNAFKAQTANISSGTFVVNNADVDGNANTDFIVLGSMTVTNALLKGYSNITAADLIISTGATFAPGNSTATVQLSGNLVFEGDGAYDVEMGQTAMDTAGHYNDTTEVGGTTTIGEDAKLTLNNVKGKYYLPEEIAIITGGVSEANYKDENITFNDSDAEGLRAGFDTRISTTVYAEGNNLMVKMERKASEYGTTTEFKKSHNEQEAATSIDAISQGNGGDITNALDTLEKFYYYETTYSTDSLKAALNDVAGVIHANATNLPMFNAKAEHVYDKIKERTLDLYPCTKFHDKIWAEYYYNNYNVDKDDNSPKYDTNVNGFLVGFDAISAKGWTLGVMAGYGTSELKQESDKATMSDINAGLYGGYEGKKWSFKSMLLGGYESYDITRQIAFMERSATSEHKGYSGALDAELGYKISLNKKGSKAKHKIYLRPFIGAIGSYMNNEGYEEKGAEDLNLKIEGYDAFSAEARAGLGINGKVKKFGWYAKAGARQLLTDKYNEIETSLLNFSDATKMKIRSAENSQTTITGGIGADYQLSDAWTIFANGLGNFGDKATNYYANVGLAYKFGCVNNKPKAETSDKDVERLSELLNGQLEKERLLNKQLEGKDKALEAKQKELDDAKAREKELQNRIQKYEANVVSESKAAKLKEKTLKQIKLKNKPTFVFGTAKLTKKGKAALAQVVEELKQYPDDSELLVEGYTDSVGPDDVNQKLSEDRAATIAKTLKKDYGVKNNISVIGKGEKDPIAPNNTAAGRATNRRVEIIITAPVDDEGPAEEGEEIVEDDDSVKFIKVKQK